MPEDIMHVLLEGLVPYETKLMLKKLIDESRCFTLKVLNQRIESFDYGYMNKKNKPTVITRETINGLTEAKLKQTGTFSVFVYLCSQSNVPPYVLVFYSLSNARLYCLVLVKG